MRTRPNLVFVFLTAAALCLATSRKTHSQPEQAPAASTVTVILVRHAEKSTAPTDAQGPDLCPQGKARAEALVTVLTDASIDTILVTDRRRTLQTAAPVATELGLTPRTIAANTAPEEVARLALEGGECVLVVGHSNTIPAIIEALGGPAGIAIEENDYDDLFVVTVRAGGPACLIQARYGPQVATPPCTP
jgi:broad specificity phosphatase PhoE